MPNLRSLLLELAIIAFHFVWLFRTRKARREAKNVGLSYDEYIETKSKECAHQQPPPEAHDAVLCSESQMTKDVEASDIV